MAFACTVGSYVFILQEHMRPARCPLASLRCLMSGGERGMVVGATNAVLLRATAQPDAQGRSQGASLFIKLRKGLLIGTDPSPVGSAYLIMLAGVSGSLSPAPHARARLRTLPLTDSLRPGETRNLAARETPRLLSHPRLHPPLRYHFDIHTSIR